MKGKERTALYRYYDSEDHLLYVGVSLHAIQRMAQHRQEKPWYEEVTRVDIEYYPSRAEAERAERFAIQQERPQHNIQHAIVDGEPVEHFTYDDLVKKLFYRDKNAAINIEIFGCAERTDGTSGTHTPGESGVARSSNQEATRFSGW